MAGSRWMDNSATPNPTVTEENLMRILVAIFAVAMTVVSVLTGNIGPALLGAALMLFVDVRRPRGEATWDAMTDLDGYQRRALERQGRLRR